MFLLIHRWYPAPLASKKEERFRRDSSKWQKAEFETDMRVPFELLEEKKIKELPSDDHPVELLRCSPSMRRLGSLTPPTSSEEDGLETAATIRSPNQTPVPHEFSEEQP